MSQAPQSQETNSSSQHFSLAALVAFAVPVALVVLLAGYALSSRTANSSKAAMSEQATAERIMPIGSVQIKVASANTGPRTGEEVFKAQCTNCHTAGMLGSPKFGDAAAWAPRIATGFDALLNSALKGKNSMPAQGGGDFSDFEVARALVYMANAGGAKFAEPAAPAGAASAASAP